MYSYQLAVTFASGRNSSMLEGMSDAEDPMETAMRLGMAEGEDILVDSNPDKEMRKRIE